MRSECENMDSIQNGAIERSFITHALLHILHPVFKATDNPKYFALILMIDFSKAFNHIHHQPALNRMKSNGVRPILVDWFRAFLTKLKTESENWQICIRVEILKWRCPPRYPGPEIFVHMVSDLQNDLLCVKSVDDTKIFNIFQYDEQSQMQSV